MLKIFLASILTLLLPINGLLWLVFGAVLIDTIFAIVTAVQLNGWQTFESNKLFNLAVKLFFYLGSIVLAFVVDTHILKDNFFTIDLLFSKAMAVFWLYIEIKSIDETSVKRGNLPFLKIIKNGIKEIKEIKKDINE